MIRRRVQLCVLAAATRIAAFSPSVVRPARLRALRAADEDFDVDMLLLETEEMMGKSITALQSNLGALRTGRASPAASTPRAFGIPRRAPRRPCDAQRRRADAGRRRSPEILKKVMVDYYGAETPLNQLASISVSSGTQLVVSPFDKSTLSDVEAALLDANLGMTPNNDGDIIRLNVPALTEERRKEILKQAKAVGEEAKVAVRGHRKKSNTAIKKGGKDLSEDVAKDAEGQIQKLTDDTIKEVDSVVAAKEKEIMTV